MELEANKANNGPRSGGRMGSFDDSDYDLSRGGSPPVVSRLLLLQHVPRHLQRTPRL